MIRMLKNATNSVLGRPSPCCVPEKSMPQSPRSLRPCWTAFLSILVGKIGPLIVAAIVFSVMACSGPTLEEQKKQILNNKIHFEGLTVQAFMETWGKPAYTHRERMQFYVLENGNSMPRFRVPMGETPEGWSNAFLSEDSTFFGYPDRGELLGFVDGRLVYREQAPAGEIHSVGKMWAREDLFKTRLETPVPVTPVK